MKNFMYYNLFPGNSFPDIYVQSPKTIKYLGCPADSYEPQNYPAYHFTRPTAPFFYIGHKRDFAFFAALLFTSLITQVIGYKEYFVSKKKKAILQNTIKQWQRREK